MEDGGTVSPGETAPVGGGLPSALTTKHHHPRQQPQQQQQQQPPPQQTIRPPVAPVDSNIDTREGRAYWESVDATVDGMLGGFPQVSKVDLQGSRAFLSKLGVGGKTGRQVGRILEGGAGIGRVTTGLLLPLGATAVDVIEPIAKFTAELAAHPGVGRVFNIGLEEWRPDGSDGSGGDTLSDEEAKPKTTYDIIWNQWCVGHLTDEQLVEYLVRCKAVLEPESGLIVVKENLSTAPMDLFDTEDSSVTREDEKFRQIFEQAGLNLVRTELQNGFPKDLLPVRSYALRPK